MKQTYVTINIFEDKNINALQGYDESIYGIEFSEVNKILLNTVTNGYSILYTSEIFERVEIEAFADSLIDILNNLLNNDIIIFIEIIYYIRDNFSTKCGIHILNLSEIFEDKETNNIRYIESTSVKYLNDNYDENEKQFDFEEMNNKDEDDEDGSIIKELHHLKNKYDKLKKKIKRKPYLSSIILKNAKNAKKTSKRHGVLIYDDKRMMRRDRKIIEEMLQDFIPGKSGWIKSFREEVLERWIKGYSISKKKFNKIKKEYKKFKNNKVVGKSFGRFVDNAAYITKSIIGNYDDDKWSNPER